MNKLKRWLKHSVWFTDPFSFFRHCDDSYMTIEHEGQTKTITLKTATEEDIHHLMTIQRLSYGHPPWSERTVTMDVLYNQQSIYMIAYDGVIPISFIAVWCKEQSIHITNIATTPAYRGCGLATRWLKITEEAARAENFPALTLEVRRSNENARRLYKRAGFEVSQVLPDYYEKPVEDAVAMKKKF